TTLKADAIGILAADGYEFTTAGKQLDASLNGRIGKALKSEDFRIKPRNVMVFYPPQGGFKKVLCAAIPGERSLSGIREAAYACARRAVKLGVKRLALAMDPADEQEWQAIGEGALLATYKFEEYKSKKQTKPV